MWNFFLWLFSVKRTLMRNFKGLLTVSFHQSENCQAGLCCQFAPRHTASTSYFLIHSPPRPHCSPLSEPPWVMEARPSSSVSSWSRRVRGTPDARPQAPGDTLGPAVSPGSGLGFLLPPPPYFTQTDRQTLLGKVPFKSVFRTDK
jgi:hypothetical protein